MKSYYQDKSVTIYNGDCLDVLKTLDPVDLVLTDPPYPNLKGGVAVTLTSGVAKRHITNYTVGTPWGNDLKGLTEASKLAELGVFSFCSFHSVYFVPSLIKGDPVALVTWYHRNAMPSICNAPHFQCEYIWAIKIKPGLKWKMLKTHYDIPRLQAGCMATERICTNGKADHPAQKPIALILHLLSVGGKTILDPYMGTGTTLRAAKDLNREAIGIDISEKYCEIAANRMIQETLEL